MHYSISIAKVISEYVSICRHQKINSLQRNFIIIFIIIVARKIIVINVNTFMIIIIFTANHCAKGFIPTYQG